jgi:signal transduction protein with GAF and PtsI domain
MLGKLVPYFFIMQLQVLVMILVGMYLVPLFGGETLIMGKSWLALAIMSVSLSIGALGYAALIAVIAKTTEQATTMNDMTQLTLGLDRDSALIADSFDERDDAVKALLAMTIAACKKHGKYVGICGQGPSDHPDLARWLLEQGIESMSLNPDTVVETWMFLAGETPRA